MTDADPIELTIDVIREKMGELKPGLSGGLRTMVTEFTRFDQLGFTQPDVMALNLAIENELGRTLPDDADAAETVGELITLANVALDP